MPSLRYYTVEQTRVVKVSAMNPTDAVILAHRVFEDEKQPEDQLNIQEYPHEIEINVREDR